MQVVKQSLIVPSVKEAWLTWPVTDLCRLLDSDVDAVF